MSQPIRARDGCRSLMPPSNMCGVDPSLLPWSLSQTAGCPTTCGPTQQESSGARYPRVSDIVPAHVRRRQHTALRGGPFQPTDCLRIQPYLQQVCFKVNGLPSDDFLGHLETSDAPPMRTALEGGAGEAEIPGSPRAAMRGIRSRRQPIEPPSSHQPPPSEQPALGGVDRMWP